MFASPPKDGTPLVDENGNGMSVKEQFTTLFEAMKNVMRRSAKSAPDDMIPQTVFGLLNATSNGNPIIGAVDMTRVLSLAPSPRLAIRLVLGLIEQIIESKSALVVGYMSEAWVSNTPGTAPSEAPDKKDAILFTLQSPECQAIATMIIRRENGVATIDEGELIFADENHTIAGNLIPEREKRTVH